LDMGAKNANQTQRHGGVKAGFRLTTKADTDFD
jgi:hypothetical protein